LDWYAGELVNIAINPGNENELFSPNAHCVVELGWL